MQPKSTTQEKFFHVHDILLIVPRDKEACREFISSIKTQRPEDQTQITVISSEPYHNNK